MLQHLAVYITLGCTNARSCNQSAFRLPMLTKLLRTFANRDPQTFPDDENGDILFSIWKSGTDISTSRTVDFSIIFPTEELARSFAATLKPQRAEVEVCHFEAKNCWDVRFSPKLIPSWKNITESEERLSASAREFDGKNDGWGFFSS